MVYYMKQAFKVGVVILCGLTVAGVSRAHATDEVTQEWVRPKLDSAPLAFTKNVGQWDEQALFRADAGLATAWITTEGAYYQFARRIPSDSNPLGNPPQAVGHPVGFPPQAVGYPDRRIDSVGRNQPASGGFDNAPDSIETIVIKAVFVGANPDPAVSGENLMDYKCNYFLGDDPFAWRTDVPNYKAVVMEAVYPGIDLVYYGNGRQMEYDFRVSAGADHSRIRIKYEGIKGLAVGDDGALVVTTAWGELRELAPVVYQEIGGGRRPISAEYRVQADHSFGFLLGPEFDSSLPVVIDPVLIYSAYLGGNNNDASRDIAVDASGAVYVTGETFSANLPTLNAYQPSLVGYFNAFVTKLSGSGSSLIYSTYFGGSATDAGGAIAVNSNGEVYVAGFASSNDFPTLRAYQTDFGGGTSDGFVVKLSSGGNSLLYSTFLGGNNWDNADGIAVDASGAAYVTGYTSSTDFPTFKAYQGTNRGGYDVFVTKLSNLGNSLIYSTYLGGNGADDGTSIAVDASGAAYVTGRTQSSDFPTLNPYQTGRAGSDAFVTKLSGAGNSLVYSTYLGGSNDDYSYDIAVVASGEAYVTGKTKSTDFPTLNAYQSANHGAYDAFVTRLSGAGSSLVFSTYLGGTADDFSYGIAVDASGAAYATGRAFSFDFPTLSAYQGTFQGGSSDSFVSKFSGTGNSLVYSTYLGGAMYDGGYGIAVDASGAVYVTGFTDSDDFPILSTCQGSLPRGGADAFVAKLAEQLAPDQDGDGVANAADNCPEVSNPCQEDNNGDGTGNACCCVGRVGDSNGEGNYPDEITLGDIMLLVDVKFVSGDCIKLACVAEADVSQDGGAAPTCDDNVTLGDIMRLVDFLFITGPVNATLPTCL